MYYIPFASSGIFSPPSGLSCQAMNKRNRLIRPVSNRKNKQTDHDNHRQNHAHILKHGSGGRPHDLLDFVFAVTEELCSATKNVALFVQQRLPCVVPPSKLFGLFMRSMLLTESAILVHFEPVRIILLVFHRVVVALFALCAASVIFTLMTAPPGNSESFKASLKRRKNKAPFEVKQLYHNGENPSSPFFSGLDEPFLIFSFRSEYCP